MQLETQKSRQQDEEKMHSQRCRFGMTGQASASGKFEILAITAGQANGWQFDAQVLKQSMALWEGVHCFVDHAWASRSVRDIAGVVRSPVWDEAAQGIRAELQAFGPASALLSELGKQVLESKTSSQVGFSADILFNGKGKHVEKILRIFSLDLVYNPARGGAFLRALNQLQSTNLNQGEDKMNELTNSESNLEIHLQEEEQAIRKLHADQARPKGQEGEAKEARKLRRQMCAYLLDSGLSASKLPKPVAERLRAQFADKIFEAAELQTALEDARKMVSELSAAALVNGPGRVHAVFDSRDRLQAAVDDLFGAPRDEKLRSLEVPRLSGIRELYLSLTGDYDLHGGYYPERVQLALTSDFTGLVKNALNKLVTNTWQELGKAGYDWWKDISVQEHFTSLNDITGTLVGTVGDLPSIAEGAEYTELAVGDSPETASFTKYGGYIPLTIELIDRDQTRKLRAYARELASAGLRKISRLAAEVFTANSGIGPDMADGGALFNATAVTSAGGHANLLTTALSANQWDTVCQAVYNQPMLVKNDAGFYGSGPKMAVNPKFILVPRSLQKAGMEICSGALVREENYVYDNVLKGSAVPVVVPEWTDANDWAAVCDPRIIPAIFIGERFGLAPEIFVAGDELSPAVFMNDEHRLKVRHYLAIWVNDFRPLHKSNVA